MGAMQHVAWIVAPLVLIAVLGFSASAKFRQGESLRSIIANLRLPLSILPPWLAKAIPAIELALCVGLLAPWAPVFLVFALATLVLVVVYWLLIAKGMTITPRPSCGCFGKAGDHRISGRTLLRNTLLVGCAGAAVALAASGRTVWTLLGKADAGDWIWLGLAVVACVVTGLVLGGSTPAPAVAPTPAPAPQQAHDADVALAEDGDDGYVRQITPNTVLIDPSTGPITLRELSMQRAQLLIFVNCYCGPTHEMTNSFPGWIERLPALDVRMVFSTDYRAEAFANPPERPLVDHAAVTWQALGIQRSPGAVLLGADGYLAGGPVHGNEIPEFVADIEEQLNEAGVAIPGEVVEKTEAIEAGAPAADGADDDAASPGRGEQEHLHDSGAPAGAR